MANLQKIKGLSKEKNIPLKAIAEKVGISEQGIHKMIRENTMSVVVLEQVSRILNANICVFFDADIHCGNFEQYNATAKQAIAAKKIGKVDQRTNPPKPNGSTDLDARVIELQQKLLEAQTEVIELLKEKG